MSGNSHKPLFPVFPRPRGDSDWMKDASCVGRSELFFSELGSERAEAKRICMRCPVLLDCQLSP